MKLKHNIVCCLIVILFSCKDDDGLGECALIDCAAQIFAIEYIDAEGNNLIANGTYSLETIVITKDNNQLNSSQLQSDEVVYFFSSGTNGDNTYNVKLNETEEDQFVLALTRIKLEPECCGPYFTINSATYNDAIIEITASENSFIEKITIVKSP